MYFVDYPILQICKPCIKMMNKMYRGWRLSHNHLFVLGVVTILLWRQCLLNHPQLP